MLYKGTILGPIWWPSGAPAYIDVAPFEADDDEEAEDIISTLKSGDFQEVIDVELWRIEHTHGSNAQGRIVEHNTQRVLVKPFSGEAEEMMCELTSEAES